MRHVARTPRWANTIALYVLLVMCGLLVVGFIAFLVGAAWNAVAG